jgi:mutual gliding-motility protein MglA
VVQVNPLQAAALPRSKRTPLGRFQIGCWDFGKGRIKACGTGTLMSIVNTRDKIITCKIVYYGPGLGGKTSSLKVVHRVLDPDEKNKLISLKTDEERTLFFDFLPIELGIVGGYKIKIQGFTVPGQVKYNLTRKYVLMGADCVVFVADSLAARLDENAESMANLRENLTANGLDFNTIPLVLQYNKQDLAGTHVLSTSAELGAALNPRGMPSC